MNVERILALADAIEQHKLDLGFNLTYYTGNTVNDMTDQGEPLVDHSGHNCGTVACIAGWSAAMRTGRADDASAFTDATWLGLDYGRQARPLFGLTMSDSERNAITQEQAVATLRHLAATGKVDWSISSNKE